MASCPGLSLWGCRGLWVRRKDLSCDVCKSGTMSASWVRPHLWNRSATDCTISGLGSVSSTKKMSSNQTILIRFIFIQEYTKGASEGCFLVLNGMEILKVTFRHQVIRNWCMLFRRRDGTEHPHRTLCSLILHSFICPSCSSSPVHGRRRQRRSPGVPGWFWWDGWRWLAGSSGWAALHPAGWPGNIASWRDPC